MSKNVVLIALSCFLILFTVFEKISIGQWIFVFCLLWAVNFFSFLEGKEAAGREIVEAMVKIKQKQDISNFSPPKE